MGTTGKILGQSFPAAATPTVLYTVPSSTDAEVSLKICNQSATDSAVRVGLVPDGYSLATKHYILYDYNLAGNTMLDMTSISLSAGDFISVYTANATVSFVATGLEIA